MSTKNKGKKETMLTEHFALSEFTRSVTGELLGIDNTPTEEQISNMKALCEKVLEPLRNRLHYLIEKRFRGELSKCEGCKLCK